MHDGFTNKYSFVLGNRKITLAPLTPHQVHEDQTRLQKEYELECDKRKNMSDKMKGEAESTSKGKEKVESVIKGKKVRNKA